MIQLFRSPAKLILAVFVLFCSIGPKDIHAAVSISSVAGPLEIAEDSYPFGAAFTTTVTQDLSRFGYVEEEFLVSGKANVYDLDSAGKVMVKTPDAPYTTINFIRPLPAAMLKNGKPIYDGYLSGDGDAFAIFLNQCAEEFPPGISPAIIRPRKEPVISIVTEGLLSRTLPARRPDSDTADDRYRRYEVPGSTHANQLVFQYAPRPGETEKVGVPAAAPNCIGPDKYGLTDFPLEYLMNAGFANLDMWARSNIPPPRALVIETGPGGNSSTIDIKRDENGNAIGGLRTPYLDIPVATYYTSSKPADEESSRYCVSQGYKVPFEKEKTTGLYPTRESYLNKVHGMVDSMVKKRYLTKADGEKIKKEAEKLSFW